MCNTQVKQLFTFNQFITMTPFHQITEYSCEIITGVAEWGVEGEGGEKERDQHINIERDGALDRNGNGIGQKWPLEKLNT